MFSDTYWLNPYLSTFLLLEPHANLNTVKNKFAQVFMTEAAGQLKDAKMLPEQVKYGLQPITDIHLNIFEMGPLAIRGSGQLGEASMVTWNSQDLIWQMGLTLSNHTY